MALSSPEPPSDIQRYAKTIIEDFEHHSTLRARPHAKSFLTTTGPGRQLQDAFLRCSFATWLALVSFTRKQHMKAHKGSKLTKTWYQKEVKILEALPPESQRALASMVARSLTKSINDVAERQWSALGKDQRDECECPALSSMG